MNTLCRSGEAVESVEKCFVVKFQQLRVYCIRSELSFFFFFKQDVKAK